MATADPGTETPETLRARIAGNKAEIRHTVEVLESRAREARDWRAMARRYPWAAVLAGVGLGLLIGAGTKSLQPLSRKVIRPVLAQGSRAGLDVARAAGRTYVIGQIMRLLERQRRPGL